MPRGVIAVGNIMQVARRGIDIPSKEVDRVKTHLAEYYREMDDTPPWDD